MIMSLKISKPAEFAWNVTMTKWSKMDQSTPNCVVVKSRDSV